MVRNDKAFIPVHCDGDQCGRLVKVWLHEQYGGKGDLRFTVSPSTLRNRLEEGDWVLPDHTPDNPGGRAFCPDCRTEEMSWN